MAERYRSSDSHRTRSTAAASDHSRPGLSAWPSATRKHCATRSRPTLVPFLSSLSRVKPASSFLPPDICVKLRRSAASIMSSLSATRSSRVLVAQAASSLTCTMKSCRMWSSLERPLSGGFYPVSAVLASREVLGVFSPGDHGSTFGGNPLACAVARAALRVIVDENLSTRSAELGAYALDRCDRSTARTLPLFAARDCGSQSI